MPGAMPNALLLLLAILLCVAPRAGHAQDPRDVVRAAANAVRTDSAAGEAARWRAVTRGGDSARATALALATIDRLTYDFASAERRYRELFSSDTQRPDRYGIHALLGLGLALEMQGRSGPDVGDLYRRALVEARAVGHTTDVGEALLRIGSYLLPFGGTANGIAYIDSALRVLPPGAQDLRATARCRRAQFLIALSQPGGADTLAASLAAARESGDPDAQGYCLRAATVLHRFRADGKAAVEAQLELIALRRRVRDRSGLSMALIIRGDYLRSLGHFGESLRFLREALAEARASGNRFIEATVALGLGGTALTLNDHATAREYIEQAIASFETAKDSASLMLALSYRPFVSLAAGDLETARAQTLPLIAYWRRHGDFDHQVDLYRQLATIEMRSGNLAAAERALDDARAAYRRVRASGESEGVSYDRGRLALLRGDFAGAERGFRGFLAQLDSTERLPRYEGRLRLAEVFARRGELARAEAELTAASTELDAWRATLADPELRTLSFQASAFEAGDRNASVALVLSALSEGGRRTAAFELAERRRARELAERMARTRALRSAAASGSDSTGPTTGLISAAPVLSARDIARTMLDDSTAVLEFVTGPGGAPTTLFVLTRTTARTGDVAAYRLPAADSLTPEIARLVGLLEDGEDPKSLARALGAALMDPALRALPPMVTRLVIVPDGPLHRVPWDALRLADGRYAVEGYGIGITPSATIAATLWSKGPPQDEIDPVRVLAFGDPHFPSMTSGNDEVATYRSGLEATGGLPRLPFSAREARIAGRYGDSADVRLGDRATAASLKQGSVRDYVVVHFATHALIDERTAARSVLALGADEGDSGFLGPADLAALDLNAALVVLSACRSAGGVVVDGEGIQGLTAPLLQAGARAVVATAWRIGDRATVPFIEAFYDALADGRPVVEALRAAKLDAIRRGAPPAEWAAFSIVGDPSIMVPLVKPATRAPLILALVSALLASAAVFIEARRRSRR